METPENRGGPGGGRLARRRGGGRSGSTSSASASAPAKATQTTSGDFGNLTGVCRSGKATGATDQGVTASHDHSGRPDGRGLHQDPADLATPAPRIRHVVQRRGRHRRAQDRRQHRRHATCLRSVPAMAAACSKDFVLAGSSDSAGRPGCPDTACPCLLPDFARWPVMPQNDDACLQASPATTDDFTWPRARVTTAGCQQAVPGFGEPHRHPLRPIAHHRSARHGGNGHRRRRGGREARLQRTRSRPAGVTDWTPYAEAVQEQGHQRADLLRRNPVARRARVGTHAASTTSWTGSTRTATPTTPAVHPAGRQVGLARPAPTTPTCRRRSTRSRRRQQPGDRAAGSSCSPSTPPGQHGDPAGGGRPGRRGCCSPSPRSPAAAT